MELLHKDDIEILDYIIKLCFEQGKITADELVLPKSDKSMPEHYQEERWEHRQKLEYYRRYFELLANFTSIVDVINTTNGNIAKSIIPTTERFITSGGFKQLYKDQQEKIRIENILQDKALDEAKVIKWTKKTYWVSVVIVVLSFIISVIALYVSINNLTFASSIYPACNRVV